MSRSHRVTRRRHYSRRLASLRDHRLPGEPLAPDLARLGADSRDEGQRLPEASVVASEPGGIGLTPGAGAALPPQGGAGDLSPHPGQVSSAREPADSRRLRLCVEPEQGTPSATDGQESRTDQIPIERPGAEPSGVTRRWTADGPRATSSDGDSPETEWAIAAAPAVADPGRSHLTDPDPAPGDGAHRAEDHRPARSALHRRAPDPARVPASRGEDPAAATAAG